jgi:hypothetical protein
MMSRRMLAIVGPLAIVAIVAGGAIAVATNSPSEAPVVSTSSSETRTPNGRPSDGATSTGAVGDDDGTADQGPGDVPSQGVVPDDEGAIDTDDGTADQGPGDVGADDVGDEDDDARGADNSGPGHAESDDDEAGPIENSGPGSVDDDQEQGDDESGEGD